MCNATHVLTTAVLLACALTTADAFAVPLSGVRGGCACSLYDSVKAWRLALRCTLAKLRLLSESRHLSSAHVCLLPAARFLVQRHSRGG